MPRLTLVDRVSVTRFPHRHWRRPAVRLIALLIVAVFVATLIESSTVTRVEALNTTLTVNSDLPHILLRGSPLSDGDCDDIPEDLRSSLHPPPNTCTLGGALSRNYPYQAAWTQVTHHPRREPS